MTDDKTNKHYSRSTVAISNCDVLSNRRASIISEVG